MITRPVRPPSAERPCTSATQRCRSQRDYRHELRPCCRGHVRALVETLATLLNEAGILWWADYGTLLGAVRNPITTWADYPWLSQEGRTTAGPPPGIVPHDKDGDLGMLLADWGRFTALRAPLVRAGHYVRLDRAGWAQLRLSPRNNTHVDVFAWHERSDGMLDRAKYFPVDAFKGRAFPRAMLEPLSRVAWEGLTLPAPTDPEAFLAMRYGPGWRTPVCANNDGVRRA